MQRPIALLGEQAVGLHHRDGVVVLHRDLEVVEAHVFEHARFLHRGSHKRLRGGAAVLRIKLLVERAGVHTDAQRDARVGRGLADRWAHFVEFADVAWIDAHRGAARVNGLEHIPALEVDVGDHRDRRFGDDARQCVGVFLTGHGHAHDVAAGGREFGDLLQCGAHIRGLRVGHRLHRDRRPTAHRHRADHDAPRLAPWVQGAFTD